MNAASPSGDYLVLKVAAGVVLGGLVLFGLGMLVGVVYVGGTSHSHDASPQKVIAASEREHHPSTAQAAAPVVTAAPVAAPVLNPGAVDSQSSTPPASPVAAASAAAPASSRSSVAVESPAPDLASDQFDESAPPSAGAIGASNKSEAKPESKPVHKLETVPAGFRCIDGLLFRELPNGFEQVTDGSEKRYCPS